jgi:MFS family permease
MPSWVDRLLAADSLWRDRAFLLFWLGRIISVAGSILTSVVLPILIFQLTGSALRTALLAAFTVLPYLCFGLFAGVLADRADRRRLMVLCDLINAALLGSIPLAAAFGLLTVAHIYVVALLSATAFVWFDAANFGALPALVGRERILQANSAIWSSSTLIEIVMPSVGGVLATTIGAANTLSLDALSYLLSAVALALIPRALNSGRAASNEGALLQRTLRDIGEGLRFIRGHELVRTLTLLGFGVSFTSGAVFGLIVVFGVRGLGLTDSDPRLGWLFSASAIGALLASLALPALTKRFAVQQITLWGLFANVISLLLFIAAPNLPAALVGYLVWTLCNTLIVINGISLRQMVTPEPLLSRVNVTARMIAWGGSPFGAAVGGLLAERMDIRSAYLLMTIGIAISTLLGWFSPLRSKELRHEG